jgi:hypothetical protein
MAIALSYGLIERLAFAERNNPATPEVVASSAVVVELPSRPEERGKTNTLLLLR